MLASNGLILSGHLGGKRTGSHQSSYDQYVTCDTEYRTRTFTSYRKGRLFLSSGEVVHFDPGHPLHIIQQDLVRLKQKGLPERDFVRVTMLGLGSGFILPACIRKPESHPNRTRRISTKNGMSPQETAFIKVINDSLSANPIITIRFRNGLVIRDVYRIDVPDRDDSRGHAPYADVLLFSKSREQPFRVSLKSNRPADWFGGGRNAIIKSNPSFFKNLIRNNDPGSGDLRIDIPVSNRSVILDVIRGNSQSGGPNDFIIIGSGVVHSITHNGEMVVNQDLFTPDSLLDHLTQVTLRVRKRTKNMIRVDSCDPDGIPYVFMKPGSNCVGRWVFECIINTTIT